MYELIYQTDVLFSYEINEMFTKIYKESSFRAKEEEEVTAITEDESPFVKEHLFSAVKELALMFGDAYVPSSLACEDGIRYIFRIRCRNGGSDAPVLEEHDAVMEEWLFCRLMKEWGIVSGSTAISKEFSEKEEKWRKEVEKMVKSITGAVYVHSYRIIDLE